MELDGPEHRRRQPGFRLVTAVQVSGARFFRNRITHGLIRRDTRMIDDPHGFQSAPVWLSFLIAVVVLLGAFGWGWIHPSGLIKNAKIVADKQTSALYVRVGEHLDPVLNLTSARLIAGSPLDPVRASWTEIAKNPRGSLVGIVGAPSDIRDNPGALSVWTVCDETETGSAVPLDPVSGLPSTVMPAVSSTVIGGRLDTSTDATASVSANMARLVGFGGQSWLIYARPDGVVVRSAVQPSEVIVADALGLHPDDPVLPISSGLFDAIGAEPPLVAPVVNDAGAAPSFPVLRPLTVATVMTVTDLMGRTSFYVVESDGVQKVGSVVATMIRASYRQIATEPVAINPDELARYPKTHQLATDYYPSGVVNLVSPSQLPVTCWSWSHTGGQPTAATEVLVGRTLPLTPRQRDDRVALVSAGTPEYRGTVADFVSMPPGETGRCVQVTGANPQSRRREGYFWIASNGVRFGLDTSGENGKKTLPSLGLYHPVPAPWPVVSLFATGATLSQRDALLRHDGIATDHVVAGIDPKKVG